MEWPTDILDSIWFHVRRTIQPGLKRRQCDRLRSELMQKWFFIVFKPFVESRTSVIVDIHPEGNFMQYTEGIQTTLVLCLIGYWNIDVKAFQDLRASLDEEYILDTGGADIESFREDWKRGLIEFYNDNDEWPNCIQDMEWAMS